MTKHVIAPFNPTEAQWGGLARHLMMWLDMSDKTVESLKKHLNMLNIEVPDWLAEETEFKGLGVPSKGSRVAWIYKAMLAELPEAQPVYLYRRKGQDDFVTCDHGRFEELSNNSLFETRTVFPSSAHLPYEILTGLKQVPVTYAANTGEQAPVSDFPDAYLVVSKSDPNMKAVYLSNPISANRDLFDVFELSVHRVPHWTDPHILWDGSEWVGYDEAGLELTRNVERDKVRDELVIYSHNHLEERKTAPTATFQLGDPVRKTKGSQWKGRVGGTYSTTLTPEGYAVESDTEKGSVQIYPAAALELFKEQPK